LHSHEAHSQRQSLGSIRSSAQALPKSTAGYVRHRPETTLLYQVIQEYWPEFQAELASQGKHLPAYITQEFDEFLKCGRLEHGLPRVPAVSNQRLSLTHNGRIRYQLKTPYSDGTTHVIFEPLDFIARLVALVPKPRVNLTRFHGVFAPNSKHRGLITPAKRGKGRKGKVLPQTQKTSPLERPIAMSWARRLKRVFEIDIETCSKCGGDVRIIASIA